MSGMKLFTNKKYLKVLIKLGGPPITIIIWNNPNPINFKFHRTQTLKSFFLRDNLI